MADDTERRAAEVLTVPSEEAMYDFLTGLNVSGVTCEVSCADVSRYGTVSFVATLTDPDADHVHYVSPDESGHSRCETGCDNCGSSGPSDWEPAYPVLALVSEWPDVKRCREDEINTWWLAARPAESEQDDVEALRDILAGWPIGGGYYQTGVAVDEAHEMAEELVRRGYRPAEPEQGAPLSEAEMQRLADALYGRGRATGRDCGGPVFESVERILTDRAARGDAGLRERMQRVVDDERANLADDGARLSHAVVRRMEAALADTAGGGS